MNPFTANINPTTGIRYGVINGNSLDQDVLAELHDKAVNVVDGYQRIEFIKQYANAKDIDLDGVAEADYDSHLIDEIGEEFENALAEYDDDYYCDGEPNAEIEHDGCKVVYSFLGGAPLVTVMESPIIVRAALCSPCVPNAGNLDDKDPDGYECYDVPTDWYPEQD